MSRDRITKLCALFLVEHPEMAAYADMELAQKQCIQASSLFVQFLRQHGGTSMNTRYAHLFGTPVFCPEYSSSENKQAQHTIVYTDDFFVDWTLRQYIEDADFPTIYDTIGPLLEHWHEVTLTTDLEWKFGASGESETRSA